MSYSKVAMKYTEAAMRGLISGASSFSSNGYYIGAGALINKPVCTGGVVNIAAAGGVQLTFVSTSTEDTNTTGTGVWTILMSYIEDSTLLAKTETITMNGTTPVTTTASNIRFINSLTRITAGGATVPIGTITAKNGATVYGQMDIGQRIQNSSFRMIPSGKVFYPFSIVISANSGASSTKAVLKVVQWSPTIPFYTPANSVGLEDESIVISLEAGRGIPEGNIIGCEVSSDKAVTITATFIGTLENA